MSGGIYEFDGNQFYGDGREVETCPMTDDQINRAISESIEPLGSYQVFFDGAMSPLKAWFAKWHDYTQRWSMEPRSWHTDENASALLFDRLRSDRKARDVFIELLKRLQDYPKDDRKLCVQDAYFAMIQKDSK